MSEASFETVLDELRGTAPRAPERLRELVRTLPAAKPRRRLRLRPAISIAIAIALAVGLGAAIVGGARQSATPVANDASFREMSAEGMPTRAPRGAYWGPTGSTTLAPSLTAKSRLQRQDVSMSLRVKNLSGATQRAVRTTRRLGGYVAGADYSTSSNTGDSRLALRVPVANLQKAIASFTDLGTILSQHISVADLQARFDNIEARLAVARKTIADLEAKPFRTPAEEARLAAARRDARRLSRNRASVVAEARYASVSLQLTTTRAAAQHVEPGRFGRFWDNAGDILGKELIAVLYALVVAGPFVLLAALAFLAERARRRRADHRLLEETG